MGLNLQGASLGERLSCFVDVVESSTNPGTLAPAYLQALGIVYTQYNKVMSQETTVPDDLIIFATATALKRDIIVVQFGSTESRISRIKSGDPMDGELPLFLLFSEHSSRYMVLTSTLSARLLWC